MSMRASSKRPATSPSRPTKASVRPGTDLTVGPDLRRDPDLLRLGSHACLVARDAVMNVAEGVANSASLAFVTVKECEAELDEIDRYVDERIAGELTSAPPK